ncbi:MAG: [protein-PII] uridylyltransferase [Hyphomicrobiales bacterium]
MNKPAVIAVMPDEAAIAARLKPVVARETEPLRLRNALVPVIKGAVAEARNAAEAQLSADGQGTACARRLSDFQDALIRALFTLASQLYMAANPSSSERIAVVAVGGYGRGTLAPGSDIDLLFLLPYKQTAWGESVVEFMLYVLWDSGFKVGHASRSVDESLRQARTDHTIQTAVLEARYICGDEALFADLERRYRNDIRPSDVKAFIAAKLSEQDARHERAGQSRYVVEPDVKDGKGGLRDLNTLFWIAKFVYGTKSPEEFVADGVFTRADLVRFEKCEDFLWAVRCHLHFMTKRATDRLSFDLQPEVASRLGYKAHGPLRQVERFMRHYFLIAKDVGDLTRIFCSGLEARQMKQAPSLSRLFLPFLKAESQSVPESADFRIEGRLQAVNDEVFARDPVNLLMLFHIAERHNVAIHPDTLALVRRSLRLIDDRLRADPEANQLFLDLLVHSRDPEAVFRRMNETGVLGRFIPDFGRIVAMMQFNMYHHYTVDEHLIRSLGVLAEIGRGSFKEEHPLSTTIWKALSESGRRSLFVATLLHDIAKGRKEDHSVAGERIALELGPRFGLTPSETETAAWLVRHHLLMSETAQMRDLNDFKTILDFAAVVQSPERLKLLLVLTVVDIRAVGPGVWNGWKGQLLRTLYFETEPVLSGGHISVSRRDLVAAAQNEFRALMTDWPEERVAAYIARHYDAYWMNHDAVHHAAHARLVAATEAAGEKISTHIATDGFTAITEITVYAPDHPRLLAMLTGACAAAGANIAGAQIYTTADGMALDTLFIGREFETDDDERRRAERVCELIRKTLAGGVRLRELVAQRRPQARLKAFRVEPRVVVDNTSSNRFTVIEVAGLDRIGLLYSLTEALFRLNLNIVSAQITTFGERAVDVFYVTDLTKAKIVSPERHAAIERELMKALAPPEGAAEPASRAVSI